MAMLVITRWYAGHYDHDNLHHLSDLVRSWVLPCSFGWKTSTMDRLRTSVLGIDGIHGESTLEHLQHPEKNGTVRNPTWFGVPLNPLVNYCVIFRISYEMTILGIYRCIPFSDRPKWSNEVRACKTNAAGTSIKSSAKLNLKTCRSTEFCVWPILSHSVFVSVQLWPFAS